MKTLNDLRADSGWFAYPEAPEMHAAVDRVDAAVAAAFSAAAIDGFKGHLVQAARKDLAGQALTAGDGYTRRVRSFAELTRAELQYVEAWLAGHDLSAELRQLGWLPAPSPRRIARLLQEEGDIPPRTRQRLVERFVDAH